MMLETLYEYYEIKSVRPTHAGFDSDAALSSYDDLRKNVFYRLMFPPSIFAGKDILEIGPDSGENSLVFARWGANLTLVEPVAEAHSYIRKYFQKFGMDKRLNGIVRTSLLDFTTLEKFDAIDAEGFIYTIQPNSAWIKKAGDCLKEDGFFIISYMELYGGFMELLTKAIYQRVAQSSAYGDSLETAKQIFLPKWESIQHTRKIDSWYMDVIRNPFVRMKYFIDPLNLLIDMNRGGFSLYSSWPNYKDTLAMNWIKAPLSQEDELRSSISFIEQSRLSHLLGCKCFVSSMTPDISENLSSLVRITDGLIDSWSQDACEEAKECIEHMEDMIEMASVEDKYAYQAKCTQSMIKTIFKLLKADDAQKLVQFCRTDNRFISTWGMPAHYAIFRRTPDK